MIESFEALLTSALGDPATETFRTLLIVVLILTGSVTLNIMGSIINLPAASFLRAILVFVAGMFITLSILTVLKVVSLNGLATDASRNQLWTFAIILSFVISVFLMIVLFKANWVSAMFAYAATTVVLILVFFATHVAYDSFVGGQKDKRAIENRTLELDRFINK